MSALFDYSDYGALLGLVANSLLAGALLGVVGGLVGFFVMARDLPFAVHGISELSFAGAAGALLIGADVVVGSVVGSILAAVLIGALGGKLFAGLVALVLPPGPDPLTMSLVGMGAFGAAVIGAPLAMTFLALENTGSLEVTGLVLAAVAARLESRFARPRRAAVGPEALALSPVVEGSRHGA